MKRGVLLCKRRQSAIRSSASERRPAVQVTGLCSDYMFNVDVVPAWFNFGVGLKSKVCFIIILAPILHQEQERLTAGRVEEE